MKQILFKGLLRHGQLIVTENMKRMKAEISAFKGTLEGTEMKSNEINRQPSSGTS